jgi:hypothetical protein
VGTGPVHQCGTFVSYMPANATRSGELIIGSITYATSWMGVTGPAGSTPHTFNQIVAAGVVRGSEVCLDGTIANSQTQSNLLTDFTVTPVAVATPSSSAAASAPPSSISPTAPAAAPTNEAGSLWWLLPLGAALIGLVALVWLYRARRAGL